MPLNSIGLGWVFTARDLASSTFNKVLRNYKGLSKGSEAEAARFNKAMKTGAAGIGLMIGGFAGASVLGSLAKDASEFQFELTKVAQISRASAKEMEQLERAATKAGLATQFDPTETVQSLKNLASQGFNAANSMKLLNPALNFAAAGDIGIDESSKTMVAAMRIFGLGVGEAELATDKLMRITSLTSIQAQDMGVALATVSRGAIATGQSIDTILPALGLMKNAGLRTSTSANAISSALQMTAKNYAKFGAIGVEVVDKATGKFRDLFDIVLDTGDKLGGIENGAIKAAKSMDLFGKFGQSAFENLLKQLTSGITNSKGLLVKGKEAAAFLRNEMKKAAGTAKAFKEAMAATFEGQKRLLVGAAKTLGIELGKSVLRVLKPIVTGLFHILTVGAQVISVLPPGFADMATTLIALGSATMFVVGAFLALKTVLLLAGTTFGAVALMAGKVFLVLTAITVAIKIVSSFFSLLSRGFANLGPSNAFANSLGKIKLAFEAIMAIITGDPVSKQLVSDLTKAENKGVMNFVKFIGKVLNRIEGFVRGFSTQIEEGLITIKPLFEEVATEFAGIMEQFDLFGGESATTTTGFFRMGRVIADVVMVGLILFLKTLSVTLTIVRWFGRPLFVLVGLFLAMKLVIFAVTTAQAFYAAMNVISTVTLAVFGAELKKVTKQTIRNKIATMSSAASAKIAAGATWIYNTALKALGFLSGSGWKALKLLGKGFLSVGTFAFNAAKRVLMFMLFNPIGIILSLAAMAAWLLEITGISDKLRDILMDIAGFFTGETEKQLKLEAVHGGRTNERGTPGFIGSDNGAGGIAKSLDSIRAAAAKERERLNKEDQTQSEKGKTAIDSLRKSGFNESGSKAIFNNLVVELDGEKVSKALAKSSNKDANRSMVKGVVDTER